eukprot:gene54325-15694_t
MGSSSLLLVSVAAALSAAAPFRKDLAARVPALTAVTAVALQAAFCVGLDDLHK